MYLYLHRKDLRSQDLPLFETLRGGRSAGLDCGLHMLILDPLLVSGRLDRPGGRSFLAQAARLRNEYRQAGRTLHLLYGNPADVFRDLLEQHPIKLAAAHADYTPYARARDAQLEEAAAARGAAWLTMDDLPLADLAEFQVYTRRQEPYKVFTPFYRQWQQFLSERFTGVSRTTLDDLPPEGVLDSGVAERYALPRSMVEALARAAEDNRLQDADPARTLVDFCGEGGGMARYAEQRDAYADSCTSGVSRHLNTGALSARSVYTEAVGKPGAESWIRQLAWRDFYLYQALYNRDYFTYEKRYNLSPLSDAHYEAWTGARTGIPIIDAAMTQLRETGEMPNRLRMVTAMFLTKNLLCPFTLGEAWFRSNLADYDNVLNRGGWLWSSSLGYDAAPYFRIMNPVNQSRGHDPDGTYIRRWLPELAHLSARQIHEPRPDAVVDLRVSRARAIEVYREILSTSSPIHYN